MSGRKIVRRKKTIAIGCASLLFILGFFLWQTLEHSEKPSFISMSMNLSGIPYVNVEIQGKSFPLEIDFGSKFDLSLPKQVLTQLDVKSAGLLTSRDVKGNTYESKSYIIPELKIGTKSILNLVAKEMNDEYIKNTTVHTQRSLTEVIKDASGCIGRGAFEKERLLLDFQKGSFLVGANLNELVDKGYFAEDLIAIPVTIGKKGIILTAKTDVGTLRLALDTGATVSLIKATYGHKSQKCESECGLLRITSNTLVLGEKGFGNSAFYLYEMSNELIEIDGILGMDFLKNHVIYIDCPKKILYISHSAPL